MAELRIFSYLPNPRIWKATITARLCGVDVEVLGAGSKALGDWLWDFDARPLSEAERRDPALLREGRTGFQGALHKTDAFLAAHPFGTVPAGFSPDGSVGIFESNSIGRAVARLGQERYPAYGNDPYTASRIDSFLDASLVFARDSQLYLLALGGPDLTQDVHARAARAFQTYMSGIETALRDSEYLVGSQITLADVCFVAEVALFSRERAWGKTLRALGCQPIEWSEFMGALAHYERLSSHEAFVADVGPFREKLEAQIRKHA